MRVVVIVFAALLTLGLAAFGVVAAQRANAPAATTAMAAQVAPPAQSARPTPVRAPVADLAQNQIAEVAKPTVATDAPAVAPIVLAQNNPTPAPAAAPQSAAAPAPSPAKSAPTCDKPDGMGLARTVEIDTTGGPAFGTEHFKQYDFLREKEVVLTFDDGPWPENTPAVIKALTNMCVKATFFEIGEHATYRPDISKMVAAAGMTVGSHTWSHKDLARKPYATDIEKAKDEIEMGVSAVHSAVGGPIAPFFRFPDLQQPADLMTYLGTRNIAIFSTDIDTFDFKIRKPDDVIKSAMTKLAKNGKGILLMHDFQHATAEAIPELLRQLKAGGYKIVHMVPKQPVTTIAKYDDMVRAQDKFSNANNTRPQSSVVKTINE
ncbi:MAG TPA: polysaccharide deacetylase family protein [Xanthobacteraceae bacterium]|nr:polysaccharide deacetylase family protein [Xanthobacteraceae bacterium]